MITLEECQKELAETSPNQFYIDAYQKQEVFYWLNIPKWMYEHGQRITVRTCLDIGRAYGTLALFARKVFNCDVYCTDFTDRYISPELISRYGFLFDTNNIEMEQIKWMVKFDVIIFTEILEHLNFHPLPTLSRLWHLLSENGRIYLSTPDASEWGRTTKYYPSLDVIPYPTMGTQVIDDHVWQYSKSELLTVLGQAGFAVESFGYAPGSLNRHFNLVLRKADAFSAVTCESIPRERISPAQKMQLG